MQPTPAPHTGTLRTGLRHVAAVAAIALVAGLLGVGASLATAAPAGADVVDDMLAAVNAQRAANGVGPLVACGNLTRTAQSYTDVMAYYGWFNHTGPDGSTLTGRAEANGYVGYVTLGENLGRGYGDVGSAVGGWMASPSHRANLLDPRHTHVGVGRSGTDVPYWSLVLGSVGACGGWDPTGSLEVAKGQPAAIHVAGWASDRDTAGAINVHVYVDGAGVASLPASAWRSDVGAHGYAGTVATNPGSRQVCVYAINAGPGGNRALGCRTLWVSDPASPFWDVLSTQAFFADIAWLDASGIAGGYADGSFRPGRPVTRQAMAAFLWRSAGSPAGPFADPGFSDIGVGHPFYTPIAWMRAQGLTTGYADGTFRGDATVSRQATAAFLWRLEGEPAPGGAAFGDVPADHPFVDAIAWAAGEGITTGYGDGTFRPGAAVSRQAMAAFLHRWLT